MYYSLTNNTSSSFIESSQILALILHENPTSSVSWQQHSPRSRMLYPHSISGTQPNSLFGFSEGFKVFQKAEKRAQLSISEAPTAGSVPGGSYSTPEPLTQVKFWDYFLDSGDELMNNQPHEKCFNLCR